MATITEQDKLIYSLVTAPTQQPVSYEEAACQAKYEDTEETPLIHQYIAAATEYAQTITGRQLMTATYDLFLPNFAGAGVIELPRPPLQSVTSVSYVDPAGDSQTLAASVYTVDPASIPGRLYLAYNQSWPAVRGHRKDVTVRFVAGYTHAGLVPPAIKQAILMLVGHWFEFRTPVAAGVTITDVPFSVRTLLRQHAVNVFG